MLEKIKRSAERILKIRPQSVFELREKLLRKKFPPEAVEEVISDFLKQKLLDDAFFARCWVRWRLQRSFGINRIAFELKHKGVDKETIAEALGEVKGAHTQMEMAQKLAERQWAKYKNIDPMKKQKRLFDFLTRRGFSLEVINKVIRTVS